MSGVSGPLVSAVLRVSSRCAAAMLTLSANCLPVGIDARSHPFDMRIAR